MAIVVSRACVESVIRVMPLTRVATDVFGVVTICLVALLILVGLLCILYSFYFRVRIHSRGYLQLNYFSGPWIIRITFILFAIWWGLGEIIRLSLLRREGKVLDALNFKWQATVCKGYIVSNLGFAEPCLFLTLVFLLRAPLEELDSGILSRKWNARTACYIILFCFPVFALQLFIILVGPQLSKVKSPGQDLPHYFTSAMNRSDHIALCTYPLMSTILLGLFAAILTAYLFWLGRQILKLVLNKGLRKRVKTLILSASSFLPLRVLLLGLSVLSRPEHVLFEVLAFSAFLALLSCVAMCICMLVYYPVADSLALGNVQDLESRRRASGDYNETSSLLSNRSNLGESSRISFGKNSDASVNQGSVSFQASERDSASTRTFVELSLFSRDRDPSTSRMGRPMQRPA
ncbi:hypothetical protein CDL15_Pgr003486 [Punica granatum]|uniref:Uncharacterized protein n=3 Tax=Punica granatum TaxID=22663 RepID=A0A218X2X7_PUNGR|nr:hypothetical protein CDL15_Pgr003486 [Punica granatum]